MSLDKAIKHGKEHRKPYFKSKRFDASCRPGGDCPFCRGNRQHSTRKKLLSAKESAQDDGE